MNRLTNTNRRRQPTRNSRDVLRLVNNRIRLLHLNQSATWHLLKSNNPDPLPYNEDTIYQRKVRIVSTTVATSAVTISGAEILAAAGLPTGSFSLVTVTEIKAYGEAGVNSGLRVSSVIIANNTTLSPDRDFDDYGIQGSRRPYIHIRISPKDQAFYNTSGTGTLVSIATLGNTGTLVAGSFVLDLYVQFKNNANVIRSIDSDHTKTPVIQV